MGNAAFVATVPYTCKATQISHKGQRSTKKYIKKILTGSCPILICSYALLAWVTILKVLTAVPSVLFIQQAQADSRVVVLHMLRP